MYPSRTEIITAMRNPQISFKASEIEGGSTISKGSRIIQYSGGYTSVFPFHLKDSNKVALRCWVADIGDAKKRSQKISTFLEQLKSSYFCGFKYVDDALLINGVLFPIVLMDWVDGKTLKEYINDHSSNLENILPALAERFKEMVSYLHEKGIAHGDLQHGNIMVRADGSLAIIDYDSMYIPSLKGMKDTIKGLEGYQHPKRNSNKNIHEKLDYFSELIIYLSLLAFAEYPDLWDRYYKTEDILFSKEDLLKPNSSSLINKLIQSGNSTITELTVKLKEQLSVNDINNLLPLEYVIVNKLDQIKDDISSKWDQQPNPPNNRKETKINADIHDISNKF